MVPPILPREAVVPRAPLAPFRERVLCARLVVAARDRVVAVPRRAVVRPRVAVERVAVERVAVERPALRALVVRLALVPRVPDAPVERPVLVVRVVRRPVVLRPIVDRPRVVDVRRAAVRVGDRFAGAFCACCISAGLR